MIFTIYDGAAKYFFPPFIARTDAEATRMFIASLGDSFPHRSDFVLFCLGSFDEDTGLITVLEPRNVIAGLNIAVDLDPRQMPLPLDIAS